MNKTAEYNCLQIAAYMLQKATEEGKSLDRLQLIKLVYIAYGWYLGIYGKSLFVEPIEAWPYGPVVRELYYFIKDTKTKEIPADFFGDTYKTTKWTEEVNVLLDSIWTRYKGYSGIALSSMSHEQGTPWEQVRKKKAIIPDGIIKDYYESLWKERTKG